MEKLESDVKKKIRITKIQKAILQTISSAGVLSVALVAPNALKMLKLFNLDKINKNKKERSLNQSRIRLKEKGLIEYDSKGFAYLTLLGQKYLRRIERIDFKIKKPKKWDGKWRILIFDISERKKRLRDQIRITLNEIGFIKLQNSVWVYPYDCEDLITLLKADMGIGREVVYIIADKIENDHYLRAYFKLTD